MHGIMLTSGVDKKIKTETKNKTLVKGVYIGLQNK